MKRRAGEHRALRKGVCDLKKGHTLPEVLYWKMIF